MKVQIYHFNQKLKQDKLIHDLVPTHLGYAEVDTFDAEGIWDLCNWMHWAEEKPENLHADICTCNHGLCLINPETKERWLAKSCGWLVGDEKTISQYVFDHRENIVWS